MRTTWHDIVKQIRIARKTLSGTHRALALGYLQSLQAEYEVAVYARFTFPLTGERQRTLREATDVCRHLRANGHDVATLNAQIKAARLVPTTLDTNVHSATFQA